MCRSNAHCVVRKKGCDFTSEAPALEPNLLCSSLHNNLRMTDLHSDEIWMCCGCSGNGGSFRKILENVAFRFFPLNGVVPY
jgi:hypothetical protein